MTIYFATITSIRLLDAAEDRPAVLHVVAEQPHVNGIVSSVSLTINPADAQHWYIGRTVKITLELD